MYKDIFNKPITKQEVTSAAKFVARNNKCSTSQLQRAYKWGYAKTHRIVQVLLDARVVEPSQSGLPTVILRNEAEAVNAALRQLKKRNQR